LSSRAACDSEPLRRASTARHWREVPLGAPVGGVLLEGFVDLLYELPDRGTDPVTIDATAVRDRLKSVVEDEDLRKYIL